ncbi:head-tail adaptor protein [Listeria monocytogenes]|nr:head-tail adaptor protein [Listeria monocytogenes]EJA1065164.1 head-tail adaptor protein [Listeria monocytogenes]EJB6156259.1 head-tail adaptor protein [Listeria monocytogenes]EJB6304113.1 head-tail adaptor protein [Listeria monocytogenes]EJD7567016.1 head-tail adaptor protein [Listeria monocytogenes]
MKFQFKPPKIQSGDLRTPVAFFEYQPANGPEPGETEKITLFECFAEVYKPSMKDLEILHGTGTKEAVTINIRDTKGEYTVSNKHYVEILDYRYLGKRFNVIDVSPDLQNNRFVNILLVVQT